MSTSYNHIEYGSECQNRAIIWQFYDQWISNLVKNVDSTYGILNLMFNNCKSGNL